MKRKKAAAILLVTGSLLALSVVSPLVITAVTGQIAQRIRGGAGNALETETEEAAGKSTEAAMASVTLAAEEATSAGKDGESPEIRKKENAAIPGKTSDFADEVFYDEPVYESREEEDKANRQAWEDMNDRLLSLSQAADKYREDFHPSYEELKNGMMNSFISGREEAFYEGAADYCFGRYNSDCEIAVIRFDAILPDTPGRTTAVLEFFTPDDLEDPDHVPDISLCTYNEVSRAFVFYPCAR